MASLFIVQFTMRSYNNTKEGFSKAGKTRLRTGEKKAARERHSTEWDVRIDCDSDYADKIVQHLKDGDHLLDYALVSGLEQPDTASYGSKDIHAHLAIVLKYAMRRDQVLALCRGPIKKTDEYCVPRNRKFTYAGWYLHHTKLDWKLCIEPPFRYEAGVLPTDEINEDNKKKVQLMLKKFGGDEPGHAAINNSRFLNYLT